MELSVLLLLKNLEMTLTSFRDLARIDSGILSMLAGVGLLFSLVLLCSTG